jgi:hypothetical protein
VWQPAVARGTTSQDSHGVARDGAYAAQLARGSARAQGRARPRSGCSSSSMAMDATE